MRAIAVVLAVLGLSQVGGEPPPGYAIDWADVEADIKAAHPGLVLDVAYEPVEDFVTVVVTDGIDQATAVALSCDTVLPVMHNAGSRALFAVYEESGDIITSWNRCPLAPPPDPAGG